jgi:hypothetical protein
MSLNFQQGRIFVEKLGLGEDLLELVPRTSLFAKASQILDEGELLPMRGMPEPFLRIAGMLMPNNQNLPHAVVTWLDKMLETRGTAEALASKTGIMSDTDLRIREYTDQERNTNFEWMKLGAEISSMNTVAEVNTIEVHLVS